MPVYNMANYLDETLRSWINQTLSDIEIICIDDASTDDSLMQLNRWAAQDARILVHSFPNNATAWAARKWGIEHATSEYILFADADDTIEACACEELYQEMKKHPVDILHFNANIINVNNLPSQRIQNMQKFVAPYNGVLHGEEIFTGCFEEKLYQFSLWNKLFSTKVCKAAVEGTRDWFLPKAQDKLLYWAIALNAQSYRGIPEKLYYNYFFGRGGTGFNALNLKQFERYCTMADTANAMHEYLVDRGLDKKYKNIDAQSRAALLNDCMARFLNEVNDEDKAVAFDLLLSKWNAVEVISVIANREWFNRYKTAKYLKNAAVLNQAPKQNPKVIATYYHSCANGGAQRVMCDLSLLLDSLGYKVIIFTDAEPSVNDYPVPANATRIVLPHYTKIDKTNYAERANVLEKALREHHVDIMLYHAWVLNMMLWDELVCKVNNVAFIGHCHNVFSQPFLYLREDVRNYVAPYILADCVVTLSKTDQYYWSHFNSNVHVTVNPISRGYDSWRCSEKIDDKQILWLGRLSNEKRPYDALYIIKEVIQRVPDVHLHIVGSNPSEEYMETFQKKIQSMGLNDHVTMHGFQTDVGSFYQSASLFLMTSEYEGYPLTLQESKLAGLPCIMYELPYLTLCEGNRGIVPVAANDTHAAAAAIIRLLTDDEMRHQYSIAARTHIEELMLFDFARKWQDIIDSLWKNHPASYSETSLVMVETILHYHALCVNGASPSPMVSPKSHKLLDKLQGGIQCIKDHGFLYTIKYGWSKIKSKLFRKK